MIKGLLTSPTVWKFVIRHVATLAGGYLVAKGITTNSGLNDIVGAFTVLAAVGHSAWDKRDVIAEDIKAVINKAQS